jgi:hypothetical protein
MNSENTAGEKLPLWRCPECGHEFVTANLWHSCGNYSLDEHFRGKDPALREIWNEFQRLVEACGPVTIYAQKTRIICMVRVRFGGAVVFRNWIDLRLWLPRRVEHPLLHDTFVVPSGGYSQTFRLRPPQRIDARLAALVPEAYAVGAQTIARERG